MVAMKQISRVGSRADRFNTDMGSVARKPENFACKDASRKALPQCSFASFGVSLRALSGASCDASEEVSVFRPRRYPGKGASSQKCIPGVAEVDGDQIIVLRHIYFSDAYEACEVRKRDVAIALSTTDVGRGRLC